ncbi:helix-turn-helix transcriptional regulator [Streptomyces sp. MNU89]|uniref:helix-turn-helix domain-containing protein n=1 Tax=Streptomyces sp. MNU89 TaxID=2560025 RepID=UPI001E461B40|nr:helix-turn-helix transcriptional regulator [Streptomyces sp. MNU89]MCC9740952.1 helix-turn-helix transcriptional regulator [Streptomyces sp. MNU89]
MSVDGNGTSERGPEYTTDGADSACWDSAVDDDGAVLRTVGRQIKLWREAAGLKQSELGKAIGYGEDLVSSVERARRVPQPEFLKNADQALQAGGRIAAMAKDVAEARYPKKVRDLTRLEAEAVEIGAYISTVIDGLLQTEEYTRALFSLRRPPYGEEELERLVAARMARQALLEQQPPPMLTFVQEEATLRRPIGGRMALRRQLEHLLDVGQLRHVAIQVMPTAVEEHSGLGGSLRVLKLKDGTTVGQNEVQLTSRLIADPKEVQILEMRYGTIRAQALTPRESLAFIEKALGET